MPGRRRGLRPDLIALGVLTLAGAAIRVATLDLQSFAHDEAGTAFFALQPGFLDTLATVADGRERTPPLYFALAWVWSQVFGLGEVGLRSLSALLGTLTIPAAFLAARELAGGRAAAVVAALVAFNPFLVWYSQEARAYALLALFITLSILFLARALKRRDSADLALWALSSVAALSSHYFAVFVVVPEALALLYVLRSRAALAAVTGTGAAALALFAFALYQSGERAGILADVPLTDRFARTLVSFSSTPQLNIYVPLEGGPLASFLISVAAGLLVLGGIVLLAVRAGEERRGGLIAARLAAVGLLLAVILALVGVDGVNPRSMIGVVPPFLIAAGIGFGAHRSGRLGLAAGTVTCVLFVAGLVVILLTPGLQRRDFRSVAEAVGAPDDRRLVVTPVEGVPPLLGYLPGEVERVRGRNEQRVQEVVIVERGRSGQEALASAPAFDLEASSRSGGRYQVSVFRAPRPQGVAPAELEEGPGRVAVLEQQPAPG